MMINLRSLEIFYWAATLASFSRAADKLNTTQPTVSQRVQALEEYLDCQLVNRTTKPSSLTVEGRSVLAHAELILRQVNKLENEFQRPKKRVQTIRLGVSETIVQTWLNKFLQSASQAYPALDFEISVDITESMMTALRAGELDMAFMLGPMTIDGIICHHLINYSLSFYCSPNLIAKSLSFLDIVRQYPVLTYPRHAYPYSHLREILLDLTGDIPRIFTNPSLSTIERMAIDGLGIALVAQGAFSPSLRHGQLVPVASTVELPPLRFFSFYHIGLGDTIKADLTRLALEAANRDQETSGFFMDDHPIS